MRPASSAAGSWASCWLAATWSEPIDNLVTGDVANLAAFEDHPNLLPFERGDVRDEAACRRWAGEADAIAHLAASISVQDSIDDPATTFDNDVVGTFRLLEAARERGTRFLFMSTCMVYDRATTPEGIDETHPTRPASPYAASKISGEALTLSYGHAYRLPVTVVRPFNTYGPFQRSVGEGGVVAIFTRRSLLGRGDPDLRGRDADPRPALRRGLRPVRGRRPPLGCGRRSDPQRRDRARRLGQSTSPRRSSRIRPGSSTSSTSTRRARSRSSAAIRERPRRSSAGDRG